MAPDPLQPAFKPHPLFLGGVLGFALWIMLTHFGGGEPWDKALPLYVLGLFLCGFFFGRMEPQRWARGVTGIFLGECAAVMLLSRGDLGLFIPMGLAVLAFFTFFATAGAIAGKHMGRRR